MYEIVEHSAGYSKDLNVFQLEKAFKLKKIRHLSCQAALHFLSLQTGDKFMVLNQSSDVDKMTLARHYISSNSSCNPDVVGWDMFATQGEAIVG